MEQLNRLPNLDAAGFAEPPTWLSRGGANRQQRVARAAAARAGQQSSPWV